MAILMHVCVDIFSRVLIIRFSHVSPLFLSSLNACEASFFNRVWRRRASVPNTLALVRLNSSHSGPGSSIIQPVVLSLKTFLRCLYKGFYARRALMLNC